jgi:nicotinate dehydrogenase subunit A
VRAFVHGIDQRSDELSAVGAEVGQGDLLDIASVRRAMAGVRRAYFVYRVRGACWRRGPRSQLPQKTRGLEIVVNIDQLVSAEDSALLHGSLPNEYDHNTRRAPVVDTVPPSATTVLVNGRHEEVHTEPDTALLYVLRNHLGLTGTRFGCGLGVCGACFVLIDGQPAYSCDTPVWAVEGRQVTTVEGLGASDRPHPVARAIVDGQAAQCGYCISGIVVAAAGLLAENDDPTEDEVRAALDRNLCRCGAHNRIVRAVVGDADELRTDREGDR